MATTSKPTATSTPSNPPIGPKVTIIDSVPTIDVSQNSSIRKKVAQCLSLLQISSSAAESTTTTSAAAAETNEGSSGNNTKNKKKTKKPPTIVALRTVHPSAGSKAITIAEIVKRTIAGTPGDRDRWWQYTKLESRLIELPPRKPIVVKEESVKKGGDDAGKEQDEEKKSQGKATKEALTNANKRKQNGSDSRASKRPKLDVSQGHSADSQTPVPTPELNPKKRRRDQTDRADDDDQDLSDDGDIPPHLREDKDAEDEDDEDVPPHLRDATDDMDTDDVPPHLRQSSPEDVPPHLRNSSPGVYSDSKPDFLQGSTPGDVDIGGGSDGIPPHLRGSSPVRDRDGSSTPKPTQTQIRDDQGPTLTSSPPITTAETPRQPGIIEEEEEEDLTKNADSDLDSSDDDGYRQFSYLDIENLPEKHTKRILEDIDEAERNRKKVRAIAIMTIFISLEKRGDLEKLYGGQTNAGEKRKEQQTKSK
ncbi:hypothetical protein TWF730_002366 [Orbilia blumenaviensis]|uniref:Uncharacterized protein n=1 Tax=Orbilia blumenaviensis TaxID=1796055 RepID=A0AAV9UE74_9PEZI